MIDIERLKTDRAYWDEVAPEGAEFYAPETKGWTEGWYIKKKGVWHWFNDNGEWYDFSADSVTAALFSSQRIDNLLSRPEPTQWRDPQDGLPPVGTECEVNIFHSDGWKRCTVKLYDDHDVVYRDFDSGRLFSVMTPGVSFRPIQTERDKAIEAAVKIIEETGRMREEDTAAALYDAGLLKAPSDE
jgi:hypothetical protein